MFVQGIKRTWTPIKPFTAQFAIGRNRAAQVVRKQFPLRPAAAKTIHRSQGDTETRIVVNFNTKRAIPHIHYVGPSRVTHIEGLYITDLCESKIAVNPDVKTEMQHLRTEGYLNPSIIPIYQTVQTAFKLCFLNVRSLHRHIEDIRKDLNYSSIDLNIFSETRLCHLDSNSNYIISGCTLFRNDNQSTGLNARPYGGTAVYSRISSIPGYPVSKNANGVEITIVKLAAIPHITIIGVYRSPRVAIRQMCTAMMQLLVLHSSEFNILLEILM